jgi:hypothetical protein
VVVAIIALLVAILIPSLHKARELARVTKCLTNQSNLPKAVLSFTTEHRGYAQLIGTGPSGSDPGEWNVVDPTHTRYEYQASMFGSSQPMLKPWPLAIAKHLGATTLKRAEQYFENSTANMNNPAHFLNKFGKYEVFTCPSDVKLINNMWSPFEMYGAVSYAANEDVFGITEPPLAYSGSGGDWEGQPWADGTSGDTNPPRAKRLEGLMERIISPSNVVLFCDGGREDIEREPCLLITNGSGMNGPYLENYERYWNRAPHFRHLDKGGIAVAMADGSGVLARPLRFVRGSGGLQFVQQYAPRLRVSPYKVGRIRDTQP